MTEAPGKPVAELAAQNVRRSYDMPFVPRRHGTLRLRLKGRGQITLRSIAKTGGCCQRRHYRRGGVKMASVMGINKIGLPKLSENMDPEDAAHCAATCTSCRNSCNMC